jgi:Protein of unknown function (DUF1200).
MNANSVYPSKIDWWLVTIFVAAPLFAIGLGIYMLIFLGWFGLIPIFIGGFMTFIMAILMIPCRYTITDRFLIIKCGMSEDRIDLNRIRDAVPSFNPLSAPALSIKRVKVILDRGFCLISPKDRDAFIREIKLKTTEAEQGAAANP